MCHCLMTSLREDDERLLAFNNRLSSKVVSKGLYAITMLVRMYFP